MSETALQKFGRIVTWYAAHNHVEEPSFVDQSDSGRLDILETSIGAKLPDAVRLLLSRYDGEHEGAEGLFLGSGLMSIDQIVDDIAFAQTLIKPDNPAIENEAASQAILGEIVREILDMLNGAARNQSIPSNWSKCEFDCCPNGFGGPVVYICSATEETERTVMDCDRATMSRIMELASDLHDIERKSYNWDELCFVVNSDHSFTVSRDFYGLTDEGNFTSFPENAIRLTYFHLRWLPLLRDFGGNNIGVDLDPGPAGKQGQIIVYGRDKHDMFVVADDWEAFLDLIIDLIATRPAEIVNSEHLHDFLQPIIMAEL